MCVSCFHLEMFNLSELTLNVDISLFTYNQLTIEMEGLNCAQWKSLIRNNFPDWNSSLRKANSMQNYWDSSSELWVLLLAVASNKTKDKTKDFFHGLYWFIQSYNSRFIQIWLLPLTCQ